MKRILSLFCVLLMLFAALSGCTEPESEFKKEQQQSSVNLSALPEFEGEPFVVLMDNEPDFSEDDKKLSPFESYSELDALRRCGVTFACIDKSLMPTADREGIGQIKPSGWVTAKYDIVDGKYLYNRCHLIGFQLTGENANEKNLITGTRYMNVEGMLPFENMVADYVKETDNRVLYRVTPVFKEDELVARGVQMEALSVEDGGEGICFNVYVFNNQPGIDIDYKTGKSSLKGEEAQSSASGASAQKYILNTSSKKFHKEGCYGAKDIKTENREEFSGSRDELISRGYSSCGSCKP